MLLSTVLLLSLPALAQDTGEPPPPVVNGERVPDGEWEDAAGIAYRGYVECSGVLVAPNVVLTAAHCIEDDRATGVILATNNYQDGGEYIDVKSQEAYPGSWWNSHDIAVLVLKEDAKTTPRLIAQDCILEEYLEQGAPVTIVGYGATDIYGYEYTSRLMQGFTTVDDPDCTEMPGCIASVSPGGELGAGAEDDVDSCYGDSGGPLYLNTAQGDFLIGLTSRGYDNVSVPCRDGGIYARPDSVLDWIEDVSGVQIDPVSCNQAPDPEDIEDEVKAGRTLEVELEAKDPDSGDRHAYEIVEDPDDGEADIDGDVLIYESERKGTGRQTITIKVTDDGSPAMSAIFEVEIEVEKAGPLGCGCSTGAAVGGLPWVLGLLGLGWRRRRS